MKCFRVYRLVPTALISALLLSLSLRSASGKGDEWTDSNGVMFKAQAVELIEPYALFRSEGVARTLPVSLMPPADCFRFYQEVQHQPARAESWDKATGKLTSEVIWRMLSSEEKNFSSFDFKTNPEPEFLIAIYVDQNEERQREMIAAAIEPYQKLKKHFGGKVEALFFGAGQNAVDHASIATSMHMPWPISDVSRQNECRVLLRHTPDSGFGIIVFTRQGDALFSEILPTEDSVKKIFSNTYGLLDIMRPENPKGWPARAHFWGSVQIKQYSTGHSDPLLVGNPLLPEGLVQRKIYHLDADIAVGADGHNREVTIQNPDTLAPKMVPALTAGLGQAVLVPAVDNGKFVDGTYHYHFQATP